VRTPKQGGTTCVGVRGITEEDLSSKVIVRTPDKRSSNDERNKLSYRIVFHMSYAVFPEQGGTTCVGEL